MEKNHGRVIIGVIIIIVGVTALLNNFGINFITVDYFIGLLWPLLLVAAGINFIGRRNAAGYLTGAILIGCGALFLGHNSGLYDLDLNWSWQIIGPVLIILVGIKILVKKT